MRVMIDIGHPAHVHFFKNFINSMKSKGHEIKITSRNKEVALDLLKSFGFAYENRGEIQTGLYHKAFGMIGIDRTLYHIAREFQPDILLGFHNPYIAHIAWLTGKPSIIFTDTENVRIASLLTFPFTNVICTPSCFRDKIPENKHIVFNGYKELAYLHPNHFTPDTDVYSLLGLGKNDPYIILRFISWAASHDVGLSGIRKDSEQEFIKSLETYGTVFISSERPLPANLEKYRLTLPPEKMHSVLSFANLYIGEGGTMAVEAALLGTPAIHIEADAQGQPTGAISGNFTELRDRYDMMYFYADQEAALQKGCELLSDKNLKESWKKKREYLLSEKWDIAEWMTRFVEEYPASFFANRRM